MNFNKYEITDNCRKKLCKYTIRAFSAIPKIDHPLILDIGCGTGEPTLALMKNCNGYFYTADTDKSSLNRLKQKINSLNYCDRIEIINSSVFDLTDYKKKFDIIIAEGLLNVIGFKAGLSYIIKLLKNSGYLIIHDEYHNDTEKKNIFRKKNLLLLESFELNEKIWWDEYYSCLEKSIQNINDNSLFENELKEINDFKKYPDRFKSIYYILRND